MQDSMNTRTHCMQAICSWVSWGPGNDRMGTRRESYHSKTICCSQPASGSQGAVRQCMEGLGTIPGLSAGSKLCVPQVLCTTWGLTLSKVSLSVTCTGLEGWRLGECQSLCWVLVDECQVGSSARAACPAGRAAGRPAEGAASQAPHWLVASAVQHIRPPACQAAAPAADVPAPLGGHPAAKAIGRLSAMCRT